MDSFGGFTRSSKNKNKTKQPKNEKLRGQKLRNRQKFRKRKKQKTKISANRNSVSTKPEKIRKKPNYCFCSDESTFEDHEKTLLRKDGFNHLFWRMSIKKRPLHDRGEKEQSRAFVCFHKLRAAIGVGPVVSNGVFQGG